MDIKIGNFVKTVFFCFSFFCLVDAVQRLELRVVNKNNDTSVTTLALGVPYTLEIKAEGAHDLYKCTIPGLENFHSEFCGASHLNLMSHISTVHSYVIRADTLGDFTLGPVNLVTKHGVTLTSNVLTLKVEKNEQSDVIVELTLDKKSVVVGQRVTGLLRVNSCINSQLLNLQIPTIDPELGNFVQSTNHAQISRSIDGKNYTSYEIPITLLFKKPGRFTLPKVGALCRIPNHKPQRMWGFNLSMHGAQDQWFYSTEPIVLEVAALPALPSHQHLLGVGIFDSVSLTCKQKNATLGEGIVAVLDIVAKEGIDDVQPPPLDLPAGLKYYESKASLEKLSNGSYKKSCEYIIQGTQANNFEIYPQVYSYFDTSLRSYKQLKTNSLHLAITGDKERFEVFDQLKEVATNNDIFVDEKICPIKSDGPWLFTQERSISALWFFLCIGMIIFSTLMFALKRYMHGLSPEYWNMQRKKNAFKYTRKKLIQLKKNNNYIQLYDVFNQLFKDRCQLLPAEVTAQAIEDRLKNAGFVHESLEQWNRFFLQLSELAYSRQGVHIGIPDDLFKRASMWINQLEERL